VIDLGGLSSKWILLGRGEQETVVDFSSNGLCAAGAGAFLEQQANRLKLTLDQLAKMAAASAKGATIAGRCSVFAKSDMNHLQQKGTPMEEIAYGLCQALARTFLTTVAQGRSETPIVLVGGGAQNAGLVRAFREQLGLRGDALMAPDDSLFFSAAGAARMAGESPLAEFPEFLAAVQQRVAADNRIQETPALPPLQAASPSPGTQPEIAVPLTRFDAYLGLDVGSVSTNLVLLTPDSRVASSIYLPTRGRPVEVLHQGLSQLREEFGDRVRILGVGATGSGRHLAAKAVGADVTHNEITAQMASSLLYFPEVDTSSRLEAKTPSTSRCETAAWRISR
jgi:activator of 2-hydroxyglutaryl-CoA dehydratase